MHAQIELDSPNQCIVRLEVVPDDPQNADPTLVNEVGRDAADMLRVEGCRIEPVYTGKRGGFLVDVMVPFLITAWAQKETILTDISELVTILTPVVLIVRHIMEAHKNRTGKDTGQQSVLKITIEIDGAPISIEAADLETAEAALKFAQQFRTQHPTIAAQVKSQSKVKVTGSVSRRLPRKRR